MLGRKSAPDSYETMLITLAVGVIEKDISLEQAKAVALTVSRLADLYSDTIDQGFMEDMIKAKGAIDQAVNLDALKGRGK
jgi:hypothetical protein